MLARFVKKEEELDSKAILVHENHNSNVICKNKGISIAERRAATCGFNASNINSSWFRTATAAPIKSPYFTVPPGISPSALLDSPVMLPNDQAQLSPTTGTFQFTSPNPESLKLKQKVSSYGNTNFTAESSTKPYLQGFPQLFDHDFKCPMNLQEMGKNNCSVDSLVISETLANKPWSNDTPTTTTIPTNQMLMTRNDANGGKERSKNPNNQEKQHKGPSIPKEVAKYSEDGYYWRKYGQKQVKGSEYPRSYFKCTNTNCQVKKKVERSHDGQITEIVYKGSHNHSKPRPLKWLGEEINEGIKTEGEEDLNRDVTYGLDYGLDITFSSSFLADFSDPLSKAIEPIDGQELSNTFGNHDGKEKDEPSRHSIPFNGDDDETGECEPKRRKIESFTNETSIMPRSNREPRVVVQIESEIDILDDGYRWRKYGQKVVKGNPNPRSYYKCTTPGCPVRKHVERAANDIKSVITTYEGKHNHKVPCIKNGNLVISDVANPPQTITNMSQKHDLPMYIERKSMLNYTDYMMSNMPGNHHDLSFGSTSSLYPLSFPPFPSIPYNSLLLNGTHHMKAFSSSNLCPMLQEYISMPSPMSHLHRVPTGSNLVNNTINNYPAAIQSCSIRGQEGKIMISKQEHRDDDADGSYEASSCLSFPNHGN